MQCCERRSDAWTFHSSPARHRVAPRAGVSSLHSLYRLRLVRCLHSLHSLRSLDRKAAPRSRRVRLRALLPVCLAILLGGCATNLPSSVARVLHDGMQTVRESTQRATAIASSALAGSGLAGSALASPAPISAARQPATVGRFGLRIRTSDRVLHLQGLFELRSDASSASIDLFDPAGQPFLHWRQQAGEAAQIDAVGSGTLSVEQADRWLRQSGLSVATSALDAWQWRRWLDLPEGRYEQGEFLIERSPGRLRVVSGQDEALRLLIVPGDPQ